mmetsp:Transcript_8253/g.15433  ORF Transcript_8253/g.15433 Transcript_8253/m.15433 type:complete len:223 (-) Transcript_8253:840-1508(-)
MCSFLPSSLAPSLLFQSLLWAPRVPVSFTSRPCYSRVTTHFINTSTLHICQTIHSVPMIRNPLRPFLFRGGQTTVKGRPVEPCRSVILVIVKCDSIALIDPSNVFIYFFFVSDIVTIIVIVCIFAVGYIASHSAFHEQTVFSGLQSLHQIQCLRLIHRYSPFPHIIFCRTTTIATIATIATIIRCASKRKPSTTHPINIINHREYPRLAIVMMHELAPRTVT